MSDNTYPKYYRHFKGGIYEYLCDAKDSETQEDLIVYRAMYGEPMEQREPNQTGLDSAESRQRKTEDQHKVWVRPKKMFFEEVERDGYKGPRFTELDRQEIVDKCPLRSWLVGFRYEDDEDLAAEMVLPREVEPTTEVIQHECKESLKYFLHEDEWNRIPEMLKEENILDCNEDVDCPPGCSSTHVKMYPQYREEFDKVAPYFPDFWSAGDEADNEEYPFWENI